MNMEAQIGWLLRVGVCMSLLLVGAGMWLIASNGGGGGYSLAQLFSVSSTVNTSQYSPGAVFGGVARGSMDGVYYIMAGVMVLVLTPVLRVALSMVDFAYARNWAYAAITCIVLLDLLAAMFVVPALLPH